MQQRTPGNAKASDVSGKWSRRPLGSWKEDRLDPGEAWKTKASLGFGALGWLHWPGAELRGKAGVRGSCSAWRRLLSPFRDRNSRFRDCGARGTRCGVWRACPGPPGGRVAREKPREVPRSSWPRPGFPGARPKMEPAVPRRRGGEERGEERGREMRGRAGNRLQRGV